jgi:hypothetical protein
VLALFTLPKLYELRKDDVDAGLSTARSHAGERAPRPTIPAPTRSAAEQGDYSPSSPGAPFEIRTRVTETPKGSD